MEPISNNNPTFEVPPNLLCPLSKELMVCPVSIKPCGHSFDEERIKAWYADESRCPVCQIVSEDKKYQVNQILSGIRSVYAKRDSSWSFSRF